MIWSPDWGAEALLPATITRVISQGERPVSVMPLKVLRKRRKALRVGRRWRVE